MKRKEQGGKKEKREQRHVPREGGTCTRGRKIHAGKVCARVRLEERWRGWQRGGQRGRSVHAGKVRARVRLEDRWRGWQREEQRGR
eukprot:3413039-Pleurochrysis_carterae.AAC.1